MTDRRRFIIGLAALYAACAGAQAPPSAAKPVRVGILGLTPSRGSRFLEQPFIDAMHELGWVAGRNIVYDHVHADSELRFPELAAALVARNPDVIYAVINLAALAAFGKTRTIPIVGGAVADPVELGVAQSLARPGGNVTGIATIGWELGAKRLQVLKEILPRTARVGLLVNPLYPQSLREQKLIEQSAAGLGVTVVPAIVERSSELDSAFASLGKDRVEAVFTTHIAQFLNERKRILELAAKQRIPMIGHRGEIADDGALMSYSTILAEQQRRAAQLVDKVLKGAKPADLPFEQPTKFELVINLKTAKALRISIPQSILLRADRVIE